MHIHILGICGTFMGGVAGIAREAGHRVTGCDANVYPPMSDQLHTIGVDLIEGYGAEQIGLAADLWIIGNVVARGNPLMEEILDSGARFISGPQWLGEHVLQGKWVLAVAGTHGKTTTSAMLLSILEHSGKDPGFLIGGIPNQFGRSARLGRTRHFVIEADEYDTAFFDKRSKFLHYRPRTQVLNNIEFDHADIFNDIGDIERQFHHLVRIVPRSGSIIANGSDQALQRVLTLGAWAPVERFAHPSGWQAGPIAADGSFEVAWKSTALGRIRWSLAGEHNQSNALAAIGAARHAGVDPRQAIEALSAFQGVKRRMELRGCASGVEVYDDFAHHPTAIEKTIAGLRQRRPPGRIIAVVEPRSQTMRRGVMKAALAESLRGADRVFIHASGLGWDPATVFSAASMQAFICDEVGPLVEAVAREAREGDRVLVMSNGGFGGFHGKLLERLARPR